MEVQIGRVNEHGTSLTCHNKGPTLDVSLARTFYSGPLAVRRKSSSQKVTIGHLGSSHVYTARCYWLTHYTRRILRDGSY